MTDFKNTAYLSLNAGRVSFQKEVQAHSQMISVVIPVSNGEQTLERLVDEISVLNDTSDKQLKITEILLVWDGAQDNSAKVMQRLAAKNPLVKAVWLSRKFGQHAATLAGIARSRGDWIVTLDESGTHAPSEIHHLVAAALDGNYQLVYGIDKNQISNRTLKTNLKFLTLRLLKHQTEYPKRN
ncbi:MAG: glycosyltransferase, partial [Deltaproteobacteria bacterium]